LPIPPHSGSLRTGRHSQPGRVYHITKRSRPGAGLSLTGPQVAPVLTDSIRWHQAHKHAHLLAFVVMPDHVHWLFMLGHTRSIDGVVHGFSSFTWHALYRLLPSGVPTLWQKGYHDHRSREDEGIGTTIDYAHLNPVREGLCAHARDWPWSTANERYQGWVSLDCLGRGRDRGLPEWTA